MGDISHLDASWRSLLLFGTVFPLAIVAIQLFFTGNESNSKGYRCFALFLLLYGLSLTPQIIGFSGFYQVWPGLTFAPFNNELLMGPLLLWHMIFLTGHKYHNWERLLLVPGVIQTGYYLVCFTYFEDYKAKWAFNDAIHEPFIVPVETTLTLLISLYCYIRCWQIITNYRHFLNQTQSETDTFKPVWVTYMLASLGVFMGVWILFELVSLFSDEFGYTDQFPIYLIMSVVILWSALLSLAGTHTVFPKYVSMDLEKDKENDAEKWHQKAKDLKEHAQREKWYLTPAINIEQVAKSIGTNQNYLSRTLNLGANCNFNQFVNGLRIEYAKSLLGQDNNADVLDIALASGFNSKASFNRAFKLFAQMTPSQYRLQSNL